MGNDWNRDLLKLLIMQKLIVQNYDFVLIPSFQHFTPAEMTVTCLMGLTMVFSCGWKLVAERTQLCIHSILQILFDVN